MYSLKDINIGESCVIEKILIEADMYRRFLDIGLVEGTKVKCVNESPSGNPKAFLIRGAVIAIRLENCRDIIVRRI